MFRLVTILVVSTSAQAPIAHVLGPYSAAINLAVDLTGTPDPHAWGDASAYASPVKFAAPVGYRTRVLHVSGDFIAVPKSGVVPAGTYAEVGWGLKTTAPDGSSLVSFPGSTATPYDNSFLWCQNFVLPGNSISRLAFNQDTSAGGLLGPDNIMLSQVFVALNSTGLTIHMEPTFVVVYQFEPAAAGQ
jgi:hypothetical protein